MGKRRKVPQLPTASVLSAFEKWLDRNVHVRGEINAEIRKEAIQNIIQTQQFSAEFTSEFLHQLNTKANPETVQLILAQEFSKRLRLEHPIPAPPREFLFLLTCVVQKGRMEEVLGDAEELYRQVMVRLGPNMARWWYRVHVLKVIGRMLPGVLMRVALLHKLIGLLGF